MYNTGLVVGKFLPPHTGHHYAIREAEKQSGHVVVLVCSRFGDCIPAELRAIWLREVHPKCEVRVINDNLIDSDDSVAWAQYTKTILGYTPDAVFTSESYGEPYAQALGCKHIPIDYSRKTYPISGTEVRKNPFAAWKFLEPCVREYFTLRFAIVGAESTGKTTIAKALAERFSTEWVPEYGRRYTEILMEKYPEITDIIWTTDDFRTIAREQRAKEDAAARRAHATLFCDTDAFATGIWHERYKGTRDTETEKIDTPSRICLYFLTDIATPFEQDGLRDGEKIRDWMDTRFRERMLAEGRNYVALTGTPEERITVAAQHVLHHLHQPFDYTGANKRYGFSE